jgi:hypothetical protein
LSCEFDVSVPSTLHAHNRDGRATFPQPIAFSANHDMVSKIADLANNHETLRLRRKTRGKPFGGMGSDVGIAAMKRECRQEFIDKIAKLPEYFAKIRPLILRLPHNRLT